MRPRILQFVLSFILLRSFCLGQNVYKQIGSYPLPGETGWDYLTMDSANHRIFIAHGTTILVVDLEGKKLGELPAKGAHGVALVADKNLGFSSNGAAGTVTVFDATSLQPQKEIKVGENPDAIIYDPNSNQVVVMNGRSKDLNAIDPEGKKVVATVPLGGKPEFAVATPGKIFVNIEDTSEIAVVDSKAWKVLNRWKLDRCEEPSGLALDAKSSTLFTVCGNAKMLVIDASSGKTVTAVDTGNGTDAAAFDAGTGYAFASNGAGTLTVVEKRGGKWTTVENVPTMKSARTMTLDPATHKVYLVGADFTPPAPGERRGSMKPGTFRLLVYGLVK